MALRIVFHRILCPFLLAISLVSPAAATPSGFTCEVSLGMAEIVSVGRLEFNLLYSSADITMTGSGTQVACRGLANELGGESVPASFDDDDLGVVTGLLESDAGFPGVTPLALCTLTALFMAETDDFSAVVIGALAPGGAVLSPQPQIEITGVDCLAGTTTTLETTTTSTTTTTTTPSTTSTTVGVTTTSTTLMPNPSCGDPDGSGTFTASDSLFVLQTSVGLASCAPQVCDVDSSGNISATDALRLLRAAVGLGETLDCPA